MIRHNITTCRDAGLTAERHLQDAETAAHRAGGWPSARDTLRLRVAAAQVWHMRPPLVSWPQ